MPSPPSKEKKSVLGSKVEPVTPQPSTVPSSRCNGPVAQVAERTPDKGEVRGSSPRRPTNKEGNGRI